jgi:hypothetical protein
MVHSARHVADIGTASVFFDNRMFKSIGWILDVLGAN